MKEIWKSINGFDNYMVSNLGRVKSISRKSISNGGTYIRKEKILKYGKHRIGYLYVYLYKENGKEKKKMYVHRLVAEAFIPNPNNYKEINHKSGIKTENCVDNLEWVTRSENIKHAYKNGLEKKLIGALNPMSKAINQYSKDGRFIKRWESINLASKELNLSSIRACCSGRNKTAGGYIWRYEKCV